MPEVSDISSIVDLYNMQANNPTALIVIYLQMNGVAQGTYDVFRTVAQRTPTDGERQIIFCRNPVDVDPSIQQTYAIATVPSVIILRGQRVAQRLDDLSEALLDKYINRCLEM